MEIRFISIVAHTFLFYSMRIVLFSASLQSVFGFSVYRHTVFALEIIFMKYEHYHVVGE
jgi:hypothetical protein